jgi:hypothetical protein
VLVSKIKGGEYLRELKVPDSLCPVSDFFVQGSMFFSDFQRITT